MKSEVLIDWLTFSVREDDPRGVIRHYLAMDPDLFTDPGYGLLGYDKVLRFGNINVCYAPRENEYFSDMGVCVSMSGSGCRTFENMSGYGDGFPELFSLLASDADANVSRLDVACDDHDGLLDMDVIVRKIRNNEINTRMRNRSLCMSMSGDKMTGTTVYIGAPSSDFRIRIYDKAAEQEADGHWVRCEMVLRDANALSFVCNVAEGTSVGVLSAEVFNDKLAFIERDDSNITRCSVCSWWSEFISELEAVRLVARHAVQHAISDVDAWLERQIAPSFALIYTTLGIDRLYELVRKGKQRLSSKQEALIEDYKNTRAAALA